MILDQELRMAWVILENLLCSFRQSFLLAGEGREGEIRVSFRIFWYINYFRSRN